MFSMHLKAICDSLIFLTDPAWILLASLEKNGLLKIILYDNFKLLPAQKGAVLEDLIEVIHVS
jgi:hypothetical protein